MPRDENPALAPIPDYTDDRLPRPLHVSASGAARVLDGLILGGLFVIVAILPVQSFAKEFAIGMCLVLLFLWGVQAAIQKQAVVVWTPLHLLLFVFVGIACLQLVPLPYQLQSVGFTPAVADLPVRVDQWQIITINREATKVATAVLASLIGIFFVAANVLNSERRLRYIINWLIALACSITLLGGLEILAPPGESPVRDRALSLGFYFYSLSDFVAFLEMVFPLPLAMAFIGGTRRDQSVLYGFAAVVIGIGIILTRATSGIFILAIEVLVMAVFVVKQRRRFSAWNPARRSRAGSVVGFMVVIGIIVGGAAWLATKSIPRQIALDVTTEISSLPGLREAEEPSARDSSRFGIWKNSFRMLIDRPLLGVGFGAYSTGYTSYDPGSGFLVMNAAHNDYLQVLCETGVIGGVTMLLFLVVLIALFKNSLRSSVPFNLAVALGATVGCMGILIHSLVEFHLQTPGIAFLFLVLIALLVNVEQRREAA